MHSIFSNYSYSISNVPNVPRKLNVYHRKSFRTRIMFALQGGQHATYFYSDPSNTANSNEPLGSVGSWDTPFSSPDELGLGSSNFLPKGAGGDRGSPLSHLPSFDRMSSGGMPAALASMGSLTLADQSAFLQVSIHLISANVRSRSPNRNSN
jgi:hypothetical protein